MMLAQFEGGEALYQCHACREYKPKGDFDKKVRSQYGIKYRCRKCQKAGKGAKKRNKKAADKAQEEAASEAKPVAAPKKQKQGTIRPFPGSFRGWGAVTRKTQWETEQ